MLTGQFARRFVEFDEVAGSSGRDDGDVGRGTGASELELSVLIAGDSHGERWLSPTSLLLSLEPKLKVGCCYAQSGIRATLEEQDFDLLLLQVERLADRWQQLISAISSLEPQLAIVVLAHEYTDEDALCAAEAGAQDYLRDDTPLREVVKRLKLAVVRQQRLHAAHREEWRARFLATHDSLTRLPNRMLLLDRLRQAARLSARRGSVLAAHFVDLDGFRELNERSGYARGDEVLVWVSRKLEGVVRSSDTLARYGGDEFVVVQNDAGDAHGAEKLANRISGILAEGDAALEGAQVSVGTVLFRGYIDPEKVLGIAVETMQVARNDASRRALQSLDLETEGDDALHSLGRSA